MNKTAKLVLIGELLAYYIILFLGIFAVFPTYNPQIAGYVLGYGIASSVTLIALTVIVLAATGNYRIRDWSIAAFVGILMLLSAPAVRGFHLSKLANYTVTDVFDVRDRDLTIITVMLSLGLILYSIAVIGGNLYRSELRNALAIFLAVGWVISLLVAFWGITVFNEFHQVIILTISMFGTVALGLMKHTVRRHTSETQPLVPKASAV